MIRRNYRYRIQVLDGSAIEHVADGNRKTRIIVDLILAFAAAGEHWVCRVWTNGHYPVDGTVEFNEFGSPIGPQVHKMFTKDVLQSLIQKRIVVETDEAKGTCCATICATKLLYRFSVVQVAEIPRSMRHT